MHGEQDLWFNTIQDVPFWGCSRMETVEKMPSPSQNVSHLSYNDETWQNYTLPKKDLKNI